MRLICASAFCTVLVAVVGGAETVEWTFPVDRPPNAPALYPNEKAPTGVVIVAGPVVALLDGKGAPVWKTTLPALTATPAAVADIDGDGAAESILALDNGTVVCLDAQGQTRWTHAFNTPAGDFEILVAADVTAPDGLEILAGFNDGWLNCLDAKGGLVWRFFGDKFRVGGIAVGDADGDGWPEIIYGTDNGHVYCLTGAGRVLWRYSELAPYGRSGPNLADLDGDGKREALITRSNVGNATCLIALDGASGQFLWRTKDKMQSYVSNVVVDFEDDGKSEVLHGDKGNNLYCENADGTRRWEVELGGRGLFWAPCVADIDGDGQLEVVAGMRNTDPASGACAYVVSSDGTIESRLKLGSSANASPAVGDIDGDGQLEVVFATEGPNQIQALSWGAGGEVAWASMRGDSAMTGLTIRGNEAATRAPEMPQGPMPGYDKIETRVEMGWWGENTWTFSWGPPVPEEAFIELAVTAADVGWKSVSVTPVKPGAKDVEVTWFASCGGNRDVSSRLMLSGQVQPCFTLNTPANTEAPPEYCGFDDVKAACDAAMAAGEAAKADTRGLAVHLMALQVSMDAVARQGKSGPGDDVAKAATALRRQADEVAALAAVLETFWKNGGSGSVLLWPDANPWDTFDPHGVPPSDTQTQNKTGIPIMSTITSTSTSTMASSPESEARNPVRIAAFGDEYEDAAINVLNIGGDSLDVRFGFAPPSLTETRPAPEPPLAKQITLRRGLRVATRDRGMEVDALPELDASGVITIAPGEAQQLWLVVSTYGLDPGKHNLILYAGTLGENATFLEIPIEIEVWPVRLPAGVYDQINWSSANPADTSDQALRDMLDHGINVFYGPSAVLPVDAQGNPGTADWIAFDAVLARLPNYCKALFSGPPSLKWPEGVQETEGDAIWGQAFAASVRVFVEHLQSIGWGYERWAFYPIDEPWNTGDTDVPRLRAFCQRVKAADPKARNYADPAGSVDAEKVAAFKDLIDVWQPEINHLKRDPQLVKWFQENAPVFWAYEAPGPSKDLLPLGHYRAWPWLAWTFGCTGGGYWCYRDGELWWDRNAIDYGVVYPAGTQAVPSRRWEASRDGTEDYRMLYALREAIHTARNAGHTIEADQAQASMDDAVEKIAGWQIGRIDEITRMTRDYELDFRLVQGCREEAAKTLVKLRKMN